MIFTQHGKQNSRLPKTSLVYGIDHFLHFFFFFFLFCFFLCVFAMTHIPNSLPWNHLYFYFPNKIINRDNKLYVLCVHGFTNRTQWQYNNVTRFTTSTTATSNNSHQRQQPPATTATTATSNSSQQQQHQLQQQQQQKPCQNFYSSVFERKSFSSYIVWNNKTNYSLLALFIVESLL